MNQPWAVRLEVIVASSLPFAGRKPGVSQLPPGSYPRLKMNALLLLWTELVSVPEESPPEHRNVCCGSGNCTGELSCQVASKVPS
jgi:hypothetical protein